MARSQIRGAIFPALAQRLEGQQKKGKEHGREFCRELRL
jgi:hypothetical protein